MTVGSFGPPIALAGFTVAGIAAHTESVRDELHINHQGNHRNHSDEGGNMLGNQVVQIRQEGWGLSNHWLTPAATSCIAPNTMGRRAGATLFLAIAKIHL